MAYFMAKGLDDWCLVDEFKAGLDPHVETARMVFEQEEISEELRQRGKRVNYALLFLGGKRTLSKQLKIDKKEAGYLLDKLHEGRPGIKKLVSELELTLYARGFNVPWEEAVEVQQRYSKSYKSRQQWEGILSDALAKGAYICTVAGRRLHPPQPRHALMGIIQGSAAEIMKSAMRDSHREIRAAKLESHLVLSVHDELGWDCAAAEVTWIKSRIPEWMDYRRVSAVVPIPVDISVSDKSWGDKV